MVLTILAYDFGFFILSLRYSMKENRFCANETTMLWFNNLVAYCYSIPVLPYFLNINTPPLPKQFLIKPLSSTNTNFVFKSKKYLRFTRRVWHSTPPSAFVSKRNVFRPTPASHKVSAVMHWRSFAPKQILNRK